MTDLALPASRLTGVGDLPNAAKSISLLPAIPPVVSSTVVGYEYSYVEFTANVTANNVAEAAATQVVSAATVSYDGTAIMVEFFCPGLAAGGAAIVGGINLWDATDLGRMFDTSSVAFAIGDYTCLLRRRITPSAGPHTYSVRIWTTTLSNFVATAGAGGAGVKLPGYIRVTKC